MILGHILEIYGENISKKWVAGHTSHGDTVQASKTQEMLIFSGLGRPYLRDRTARRPIFSPIDQNSMIWAGPKLAPSVKYPDDVHDVRDVHDVLDDDRNQILDVLQIKIQDLFEPLS